MSGPDARTGPAAGGRPDHSAELARLVGQPSGPPTLAPDAVGPAMVRHWVEAMGDLDPVYVSDAAARAVGLDRAVAPPAMLQAWTMPGLRASQSPPDAATGARAHDQMMALLDDEGLTSVVATDCEQTYTRPLVTGDRLVATAVIESISAPKATALGTGRFVTTRTDFHAVEDSAVAEDAVAADLLASAEPVGTMTFRFLKFRPRPRADESSPRRPRPAVTEDNAFFLEGARRHRLLIQRCASCGRLRHPPLPACPACRSFEWDTVEASGRGELYSFVVVHHPQVAGFDYPLPVGLIALEEGTRLVAGIGGVAPEDLRIGMPMVARFEDLDDELSLPVFHPAEGG